MKEFIEFTKEGKVIKMRPDPAEARSLFAQSKERLADIKTLPLNERNAPFRFEEGYEALREALHAFMAQEGYKPYSHEAIFSFAMEKKLLAESEIMKADRYREIRNDINYRGKSVTVEEAMELISFINLHIPLLEKNFLGLLDGGRNA